MEYHRSALDGSVTTVIGNWDVDPVVVRVSAGPDVDIDLDLASLVDLGNVTIGLVGLAIDVVGCTTIFGHADTYVYGLRGSLPDDGA